MVKHFFNIHSNITLLIAKQYIEDKGINTDDCILFLTRGYKIPQDISTIFKNTIAYPNDVFKGKSKRVFQDLNIIKGRRNIRILEDYINGFTNNGPFIFYYCNTIPKLYDFVSVSVTMKNCIGYYLLEEGSIVYFLDDSKMQIKMRGVKKLIFKVFLQTVLRRYELLRDNIYSTNSPKYKGCIAISEYAFPSYPKEKFIVSNPFTNIQLPYSPDYVMSIDPLYLFFDINVVKKLYQQLATFMKRKSDFKLAYKFHPAFYDNADQYTDYKNIIKDIFGDKAIELDRSIILENVIISCRTTFFTDMSSVAIYAGLYGIKSYSYYKLIYGINKDYDKKLDFCFSNKRVASYYNIL